MTPTAPFNINRLSHLLTLYGMSKSELLLKLNISRKRELSENEVFTDEIKLSTLKKIDEIFKKGLGYYSDPKDPLQSKEESIFFRKDHFNAELNLGAKQIVNRFEEEKISFSVLAKLSDFNIKRRLLVYKISDNPQIVATEIRSIIYPDFSNNKRDFLKGLIGKLAENNILVFEWVETHNKREKSNINGFYLSPNVIVLKRNQKSLRREIFTLAHELGHYLLNEEEIDDNINEEIAINSEPLSRIERWCNDFAYYFLIGDYETEMSNLKDAIASNDYHFDVIERISGYTNLSTVSLFTRLLLTNKITPANYKKVTDEILESIKNREREEKEKLELEKQKALEEGRKIQGAVPRPIISPLYLQTLQTALYNGLINESDFCKRLNINADKIDKYIS
jgi:Zn-dependent peptidase ImmA (M78 family)